jgi:RecA-family ATPase
MSLDFYIGADVLRIPPQEYLIKPLIPEGLTLLSAPPKTGKSILALDWGLSLSTGLNWMGYPCRQATVLYVLSEARSTLPPRVTAWERRHGKHPREITYALGATNLCDTAAVIHDLTPHIPEDGMIIWDTMARNMVGADENDFRAMGALVRTCDTIYESTGTSSLLVHHSTKEHTVQGGGKVTSSWYRGHSSLLGAIDMGMTIDPNTGYLECRAARHDEEFEAIPLIHTVVEGSIIIDWREKGTAYR